MGFGPWTLELISLSNYVHLSLSKCWSGTRKADSKVEVLGVGFTA